GELFAETDRLWQEALKKDGGLKALPDPAREMLRQVLYNPNAPPTFPVDQLGRFTDRAVRDRLTALRRKVDQWKVSSPVAPPRAMTLQAAPAPVTPRVFLRGNPTNPGPTVPRQFLECLTGEARQPFHEGSGRLELARAIASKDNPLTARVLVNRVW